MKILVCIKQVPDPETKPDLDERKGWVKHSASLKYRMNPLDEHALEEAIRMKESFGGVTIDVLSLGPARVGEALKRAIAMGADYAIHIDHPYDGFIPAQTTAKLIARHAQTNAYGLIMTGAMAEDDMQGLVGPMIADILGISCAVSVVKTALDSSGKTIGVTCELERGRRQEILLSMPALITIQSGINRPRYPSLPNMLRSMKQEIRKILTEELPEDSVKFYQSVTLPWKSEKVEFIDGSLNAKVEKLLAILSEKSLLR